MDELIPGTHRRSAKHTMLSRGPLATSQVPTLSSGWIPWSRARPGRWALVQVWDGAVLASFEDETSAREAMIGADDDEVVVLYLDT